MNREHKIALILGFAVVLVVGVLVSDHWSGARQLQLADATEGDSGRIEVMPVAVLPDPKIDKTPLAADPQPKHAPKQHAPKQHAPQPSIAFQPTPPIPTQPNPQTDGVVRIPLGGAETPSPLGKALQLASENREQSAQHAQTFQDRVRDMGTRVANGLREGVLPAATVVEQHQPAAQTNATRPPAPRVVEVPERQPIRHRVAKNESLYKIAAKYLGNGNRWREIAQANPDKVGKNGTIRVGVVLVIPETARRTPPSPQSIPAQNRHASGKPGTPRTITYTVVKNDSLGKISQRFLGTVKRMDEIIQANPGKIDDPDDIRVGMVLTIPAQF